MEDDEDYKYKNNIAPKIKNLPSETVKEIVFLDNDLIMILYNYFMETEQYKFATLLALAYESGGRKSELAQVNKYCIINKEYSTNIVEGKRGKKFTLIYFDLTQQAGEKYLEQRGNDNCPNLFITNTNTPASPNIIYNWVVSWRNILEKLTGKYYNFNVHSFRHSCLQNMINNTHEVYKTRNVNQIGFDELRKLAHHESIAITTSYLKKEDDTTFLKDLFSERKGSERKDGENNEFTEKENSIGNNDINNIYNELKKIIDLIRYKPCSQYGQIDNRLKKENIILTDEDDFIF